MHASAQGGKTTYGIFLPPFLLGVAESLHFQTLQGEMLYSVSGKVVNNYL